MESLWDTFSGHASGIVTTGKESSRKRSFVGQIEISDLLRALVVTAPPARVKWVSQGGYVYMHYASFLAVVNMVRKRAHRLTVARVDPALLAMVVLTVIAVALCFHFAL